MSLKVQNLSFSYRCWKVLNDVNFKLDQAKLVCVLGKNGAGKSTLFRCILGLLPHYKGSVIVNGKNIKDLNVHDIAASIAYIPQNHLSAFNYSVIDMVLMGTSARIKKFSGPKKGQYDIAMDALEKMNIVELADRNYAHISGGEQQLVLIARVIAQQAKIIIMDEPCSNLDYGNQIKVMQEVKKLASQGYLIVQSTHSPQLALLFADQVIVLDSGKVAGFGSPYEVINEKTLLKVYGVSVKLHDIPQTNMRVCIPDLNERGKINRVGNL